MGHSESKAQDCLHNPYTGVLDDSVVQQVLQAQRQTSLRIPQSLLRLKVLTCLDPQSFFRFSGASRRNNVDCETETACQALLDTRPWPGDVVGVGQQPTTRKLLVARWQKELKDNRRAELHSKISKRRSEGRERLSKCKEKWRFGMGLALTLGVFHIFAYPAVNCGIVVTIMSGGKLAFASMHDCIFYLCSAMLAGIITLAIIMMMLFGDEAIFFNHHYFWMCLLGLLPVIPLEYKIVMMIIFSGVECNVFGMLIFNYRHFHNFRTSVFSVVLICVVPLEWIEPCCMATTNRSEANIANLAVTFAALVGIGTFYEILSHLREDMLDKIRTEIDWEVQSLEVKLRQIDAPSHEHQFCTIL